MVYASVPSYLDPPNWNQQHQHQHQQQQQQHQQHQQQQQQQSHQAGGSGGGLDIRVETTHGILPPEPSTRHENSGPGSVRPGSMADRARLAKIPQPEPALKCPRCDSTNTKFCYFNNYSLSQPRHFCKTCRRYWTRGGALRSVPVGGGCRRNKRSKSSSSKSSASTSQITGGNSATPGSTPSSVAGAIGCNITPPPLLPFMHHLADYGAAASNIGLNYGGIQTIDPAGYQVGSSSSGGVGFEQQWRLQQLPFFAGAEPTQAPPPQPPSLGLYSFDGEGGEGFSTAVQAHGKATAAGLISQLASVKMEENRRRGLSLPRQYLGIPGHDQFWSDGGNGAGGGSTSTGAAGNNTTGGSAWTDLSGFNSSSTDNLL